MGVEELLVLHLPVLAEVACPKWYGVPSGGVIGCDTLSCGALGDSGAKRHKFVPVRCRTFWNTNIPLWYEKDPEFDKLGFGTVPL